MSGVDATEIFSFFAYDPRFVGGVEIAVADLDGDGFSEVITGSGPGARANIRIFDGITGRETDSFETFDGYLGGIRVAVGDTNADGTPDIVVGAQGGADPRVSVYDGKNRGVFLQNFFAFEQSFRGGVFVAVGDTNGDGFADIIVGRGTGGTSEVSVVSGRDGLQLASFQANEQFQDVTGTVPLDGGVRVASVDIDNDGIDDILTAKGPGTFPILRFYKLGVGVVSQVGQLQVFSSNYASGVYVGG